MVMYIIFSHILNAQINLRFKQPNSLTVTVGRFVHSLTTHYTTQLNSCSTVGLITM